MKLLYAFAGHKGHRHRKAMVDREMSVRGERPSVKLATNNPFMFMVKLPFFRAGIGIDNLIAN
jgi:hypothetical protein